MSSIYTLLKSKSHNTHYLKRYIKFIEGCKNQQTNEFMEAHHILPKSKDMFPEYKSFKKYPENKINLTLRQHYIAHYLLWKTFGHSQAQAFKLMCLRSDKSNSKIYENVRKSQRLSITGISNPNSSGKYSKIVWENSSDERRVEQSKLMSELNRVHKTKPKQIRYYKCSNCGNDLEYEEFIHHHPKEHYYCNPKCRNTFISKTRKSTKGIPRPNCRGRIPWNKGLKLK